MVKHEKTCTPEQIENTEKLCQFMWGIPDAKRQIFSVSILAYMNGLETGLAMSQNAQKPKAG